MMLGNFAKNGIQRAHLQSVVVGNRDLMLATDFGRQTHMAASLPRHLVTQLGENRRQFTSREITR